MTTTRTLRSCLGLVLTLVLPALADNQYGLETRVPIGGFLNGNLPKAPAENWTLVEAFPGLKFDDPVCLRPEPRGTRLFVCERQGRIYSFDPANPAASKRLVLDISTRVQGWEDCGLMGIAFHPDFNLGSSANKDFVYIHYQFSPTPQAPPNPATDRPNSLLKGYNRLARFTLDNPNRVAIPASEQVLVNQFDENLWHNGGSLFFGTDGFLYFSVGDEGGVNDAYNNTQVINQGIFSGVFRIDVDRRGGSISHPIRRQPVAGGTVPAGWPATVTQNYYVPNDNPWQDVGGGVLEEFYAIGLRSPHTMTFDPPSGKIMLGDVGQAAWEEVDVIERGGNYQWAYREGNHPGPKAKPAPLIGVDRPPLYDYPHDNGNNCVIGGFIYHGSQFPELANRYLFGDNVSGRVWALTFNPSGSPTVEYLTSLAEAGFPYANNYLGLASFGIDHNGEQYLLKLGNAFTAPSTRGIILKLARSAAGSLQPPARLSLTGAFASLNTLAPTPGVIPFAVNSPLWSDAAHKQRWMVIPNNGAPYGEDETIGFSPTGEWTYPVGTVMVKHFELGIDERNPNLKKRLETRFLVRGTNGQFFGYTYKWRADGSDADLLPAGLDENITITTATGATRIQSWHYPSRSECLQCHNQNANGVLGPKTRQLNGDYTYSVTGRTDNQLRALNHIGIFDPPINEENIPGYARTVPLTDEDSPVETRVRSYIDSNCAHCHRPGGVAAMWDGRFDTPISSQNIINGEVFSTFGIHGAKEVVPRSLEQSLMYLRASSTESGLKMPPLAKNLVDAKAVDLIAQWINSLPDSDPLPEPWEHQDIGPVGLAGSATFAADTFTLAGSGADIWGTEDAFHFVTRSWEADGELVVRVASQQNTHVFAKAGLTFRDGVAANAAHATVMVTPSGVYFQRRETSGATTVSTAANPGAAPRWLRLRRQGNVFSAYVSANGSAWTFLGSDTISMSTVLCAGLVVCSHDNAQLSTATFDNLSLLSLGAAPVVTLTGPADQSRHVLPAAIPVAATVEARGHSIARVEFLVDGVVRGSDASSPYSASLGGVSAGTHVLVGRAVYEGGAVSVSAPIEISVGAFLATDDVYAFPEDGELTIALPGVLSNDPEILTSVAELVEPTLHGVVSLAANGSFRYTPNPDFRGQDHFVYRPRSGTSTGTVAVVTLVVNPINDAPLLVSDRELKLSPLPFAASYNLGNTIAEILDSVRPLDPVTDPDAGAFEGIALIEASTANGVWQYSLDGGNNWQSIGAVSQSSSRLLAALPLTRLRFVPSGLCPQPPGLTFRAWDRTDGVNGGTADTRVNGGTTAFSHNSAVLSIEVHDRDGFVFEDFRSPHSLRFRGSARPVDGRLRVTPAEFNRSGAVWYTAKQTVGSGFATEFTFQFSDVGNGGADGFAFVIQNSDVSELGTGGAYVGYGGIPASYAIEFDTWYNTDTLGDPDGNHASIHSSGVATNTPSLANRRAVRAVTTDLQDGFPHRVRVEYAGSLLRVYLDNFDLPILADFVDLTQLLGLNQGRAFVGFTSGTGSAFENHDILDWSFHALPNSPNYPNFFSKPRLRTVGDATTASGALRLTPSVLWNVGAAWFEEKQTVVNGFSTFFRFRMADLLSTGADGLSFVIQNQGLSAIGDAGDGMGYRGIANSVAIEFDGWDNGIAAGDYNANHVAIHSAGTAPNAPTAATLIKYNTGIPNLEDGALHEVRVDYTPGLMEVYLDNMAVPVISAAMNLDALLNLDAGQAYVGFVGATGGAATRHDITSWYFTPAGAPDYPHFEQVQSLALLNAAHLESGVLRVTDTSLGVAGAAWHRFKQPVSGGFETDFTIQFSDPQGGGADALSFVIQNTGLDAVGVSGGGLGYQGIANSLVVEFDTWDNGGGAGDPNGNHVAVHSAGLNVNAPTAATLLGASSNIPDLSDGQPHRVRVRYDPPISLFPILSDVIVLPLVGSLSVYVDDFKKPALQVSVTLGTKLKLDAGKAWVGFVASTGGASENHDVLNWVFRPLNQWPTFTSVPVTTATEDVAYVYNVKAKETDPCDALRMQALIKPAWLSFVDLGDGNAQLTGTPDNNCTGDFLIRLGAFDGHDTAEQEFILHVGPVDDPPTVSAIADLVLNEDSTSLAIPFTVSDVDDPAGSLIPKALSSQPAIVPLANITFGGAGANRTVTVKPAANQFGSVLVTVEVSDPTGLKGVETFNVTVNPVNDRPTLNDLVNLTIPADSPAQTVNLSGIGTGAANEVQVLTVTAVSSDVTLIPHPVVTYVSPGATGSLKFAPLAGRSGTTTISVRVRDNGGVAAGGVDEYVRTFNVTVTPPEVRPVLRIAKSGANQVLLAWPVAATGWRLEYCNAMLDAPVWGNLGAVAAPVAGEWQVFQPSNLPLRHYRLVKP